MLLRNANSNIRNISISFQLLDYQSFYVIKERLRQNREQSNRIKLNP